MAEKFHERFQIKVDLEEAKRRFVNRAKNEILSSGCWWVMDYFRWKQGCRAIATALGEAYRDGASVESFIRDDFLRTTHAIEALGEIVLDQTLDSKIKEILTMSEVDLGIRWLRGGFLPTGAETLDNGLVNDSLRWLREGPFPTVLQPFEKALDHLMRSQAKPELLTDVVTDAYEALEALAKIVCSNEKTLDSNRELFIGKVKASEEYKKILRDYTEFAHKFRHGAASPEKKPIIGYAETESFVYLTGLFIRLVISAGFASSAAS